MLEAIWYNFVCKTYFPMCICKSYLFSHIILNVRLATFLYTYAATGAVLIFIIRRAVYSLYFEAHIIHILDTLPIHIILLEKKNEYISSMLVGIVGM